MFPRFDRPVRLVRSVRQSRPSQRYVAGTAFRFLLFRLPARNAVEPEAREFIAGSDQIWNPDVYEETMADMTEEKMEEAFIQYGF